MMRFPFICWGCPNSVTMKFQRKRDLKQQIRQMQSIIAVQEQGKKLFAQSTKDTLSKNRDLINFLLASVRDGMHELNFATKYDQVTINRACRDRKHLKIFLSKETMEKARELLSAYVFDRMNVHNLLQYEVKKRGEVLQEMQLRLQKLMELETPSPEIQAQLQIIRQLENNIEKMHVKISTGQNANTLYLKMIDVLRNEVAQLPFLLDNLEHMVEVYEGELNGMHLMAIDSMEATEMAKAEMENTESELIAEKKFRENSLSSQKKQIERIRAKEASDRHKKMGRRDLAMEFPSLGGWETVRGAKLEVSKSQVEYQGLVTNEVEKIKNAVQCSHLWDIAGRFTAQKKSEENLQQQIAESEKKRRDLKAQLKKLELERAELKFHQTQNSISFNKLSKELRKNLEKEDARLQEVQSQAIRHQELLLHFENGVENLAMRLCGITVPGQEDLRMITGDIFEKLQFCEVKLMHLLKTCSNMPSDDFSKEETNETFVHVRNFLEESTRDEHENLRITFEEDEEDVREVFNFSDIDHSYVPNREELKKQGLKLIEDKTKVSKKKQRGPNKK
ncbi:coiled-coil domain-containing protein 183 isoform X2 [Eublepharis macularius]|uniref:Coiled-coil domain-containing protein 183 isoform X2 n=1 Tax=Eublepharis macularius TaxID=481883 RepID=A0AA97KD07_EUBMA|nr:coiled-coil domain-containing protein 183 isoform X2 [Eublepharis macularius]